MEGSNANKRKAEDAPEEDEGAKRQNVTMMMEVLDCPACSNPLSPPIFQCSEGNFICKPCRGKLPKSERTASRRCYGMERVVDNTIVPCKHGCATEITYYQQEEHEGRCLSGPCFCPVSGCGFAAPNPALLDHLTILHKLPVRIFDYFEPFDHPIQSGSIVLCCDYGRLFLLDVVSHESLGHAVSLVCAQPSIPGAMVGCSVCFSCFEGHYQASKLEIGGSLPTLCLCVVPKVSSGEANVVLRITIDSAPHCHEGGLEEEEDDTDDSYDEEEDDHDHDHDNDNLDLLVSCVFP